MHYFGMFNVAFLSIQVAENYTHIHTHKLMLHSVSYSTRGCVSLLFFQTILQTMNHSHVRLRVMDASALSMALSAGESGTDLTVASQTLITSSSPC